MNIAKKQEQARDNKREVKGKIMKNIKMLAVASMISLGALSMVACQKTEPDIKIEKDIQGTGISEYKGDVEVTPQAPTQIQNTGDPIKDEASWPIGKFGYHEPPMELRTYDDPNEIGYSPDLYYIKIYDEKYGNLSIQYNSKKGSRAITKLDENGKEDYTNVLMRVGGSVSKSISELLQDLREGDVIADAWGK